MTDHLPLPPIRCIHIKCLADAGVDGGGVCVDSIVGVRKAVAVHMEDVRGRAHGVDIPDHLVVQAHLKGRVVGEQIAVPTPKSALGRG